MSQNKSKTNAFKSNNYVYTKAIVYCRVSSDRQVNEGHGLESQEKRCIDYARNKKYTIDKVFKDEGFSGGKLERPGISELIKYIDDNPLTNFIVIFDDLSRLARDVIVYASLKHSLEQRGCRLESPNFQFDDTEENELMQNVTTAFNQYDRKKNRRQVIQKQKARMEQGYWCLCAPTGYQFTLDPVHGKILKPTSYSHIIKESIEKYASNQLITLDEVVEFINKQYKVQDVRKDGKIRVISRNGVNRLLKNPLMAGYLEYDPWGIERRDGQHEALITKDTFQVIQDKLLGRSKKPARKDYSSDFPLRGFVVCDNCLKEFTASWNTGRNKRYANYTCKNKECAFRWKSINREKIEPEFEAILSNLKPDPKVLEFAKAVFKNEWQEHTQNMEKHRNVINKEVNALQKQIDTLVNRISKTSSETIVKTYEGEIEKLDLQKTSLLENSSSDKYTQFNFGTALDEMMIYIEDPLAWWKSDSYNDKTMLLQTYFDQKLRYNLKSGFGIVNLSLPAKIFTAKRVEDIQLVEMAGVEPASGY